MDHSADWFFIAGDMTALPALTLNINDLPENAMGVAHIEVLSEQDIQQIDKPNGLQINWVVNPEPGSKDMPLAKAAIEGPWIEGSPSTWVACEFNSMKAIRSYLKKKQMIERARLYTSSYWKNGLIEDQHKVVKRADTVQFEATSP